jgi:hypothetical protein
MAQLQSKTGAPLLCLHDLAVLAKLPVSTVVAWCVPEAWWRLATGPGRHLAAAPRASGQRDEQIDALFAGHRLAQDPRRILPGLVANLRRDQLNFMRSHRPGGWHPQIDLVDRRHLDRALEHGRGAILWVAPFVFSSLVTKRSLHAAGYAVSHLSRMAHGFSGSRFGMRLLNPLRIRIENRYLAERVVIGSDDAVAEPLRRLMARLRANRIVSINAGAVGANPWRARCLNGWLELARGAPNLMARTGAALLPVITVRTGERHFTTTIEPPLQTPAGLGRNEAIQAAIEGLAARLEPHILRWPDQFNWRVEVGRVLLETAGANDQPRPSNSTVEM